MKPRRSKGQNARLLAMLALIGACASFAAWPVSVSPPPESAPDLSEKEPAKKQTLALDLAAFRVPLWVADPAPPPPPVAAAPPSPPSPLKLQLLAIIHESDVYKAAVYDPDSDRILVVAAGERIGGRSVDKIDKASLTLRDDTGKRVLALRPAGEGS